METHHAGHESYFPAERHFQSSFQLQVKMKDTYAWMKRNLNCPFARQITIDSSPAAGVHVRKRIWVGETNTYRKER